MRKKLLVTVFEWLFICILLFFFLEKNLAYHYYYVGQFRLFQYHSDEVMRLFSHPGGLVEYVATWLVQGWSCPYAGALTDVLLFLCIGTGLQCICKKLASKICLTLLWLLPGILLLFVSIDFNYHLEGTLAFALSVWVLYFYLCIASPIVRVVYMVFVGWGLFFLVGSAFEVVVICAVLYEWSVGSSYKKLALLLFPLSFMPALWWYMAGANEAVRIVFLPDAYFHSHLSPQPILYYAWLSLPVVFLLACMVGQKKNVPRWLGHGAMMLVQLVVAGWIVYAGVKKYRSDTFYQIEELDHYAQEQQWDKLLSFPLRSGQNSMHACFQNLALAEKGMLADKLFSFGQTGADGLWIPWNRSVTSSALLSDVYYAMGLVALSQRMAFEGMIASEWAVHPRLMVRLVKTNLIYGNHAVAARYLRMLDEAHVCKEKVQQLRCFVGDDKAIDKDPELGTKRRHLAQADGLINLSSVPEGLFQMASSCPDNKIAVEYLGCYCLLKKDIASLLLLLEKGYPDRVHTPLPLHFQEAVALAHEADPSLWEEKGVSATVADRFRQYKQLILENRGNPSLPQKLRASFGNTYWYYYMFKK